MAVKPEDLLRQYYALKQERTPYDSMYREVYEYTYPQRGLTFAGEQSAQMGMKQRAKLLDSTLTDSTRLLASTYMSGLTPANARWLSLRTNSRNADADAWLDTCSTQIWSQIHAANFDSEGFEFCLDAVICGWAVMHIDQNRERGGLVFTQWPSSECFVASTNQQTIDTVFRRYKLTAEQAYAEFGEAAGHQVMQIMRTDPQQKIDFVHAIFPRTVYAVEGVTALNMPFASVHLNESHRIICRESGYHEFPCVIPRVMRIPGSAYATGQAQDALPDAKELNELKKMELASAEIAIGGLWLAVDDGVLNPKTIKIKARSVIVANSADSLKPLQTGANFQVSFAKASELQAQIRRIMMSDQLEQRTNEAMTATEVNARMSLIRQQLGPIYGRLMAEYLTPLVERCFWIMFRAGVLPEPPEAMANENFTVHFDSPLARAQKLQEVAAMDQFEQGLAMQMQMFGPGALDIYDLETAQREKAIALGIPMKVLLSEHDIAVKRQQQAEAQQAAMEQQQQMQMQQAAGQAALNAGMPIAAQQQAQGTA